MSKNTQIPATLRVLVINEGGTWLAQCLEVDVSAQADNMDELRKRLLMTLRAELSDQSPETIGPAPKHFHDLWERATPLGEKQTGSAAVPELELALAA